eukprot:SAG31_NODE_454_length_15434_cov_39.578285_5_plen_360_part_00
MKGSTLDAMSEAVEGSDVMLYGVSKKCEWHAMQLDHALTLTALFSACCADKESVNCRLECQYGHQQKKDMIPLMMEENFCAMGWLGLILGSRIWYAFWPCKELEDEARFESRMDQLAKEIGERGKRRTASSLPQAVPPPKALEPTASASAPVAPAPAPAPAPAATPTPSHDYSPTMPRTSSSPRLPEQLSAGHRGGECAGSPSASLLEVLAFIKEEREESRKERIMMESKMDAQRQEMRVELERQRQEMKVEVQRQWQEVDKLRAEVFEARLREQAAAAAASEMKLREQQFAALQLRIAALHAASLLTDDELFKAEDAIMDSDVSATRGDDKVLKMIMVSQRSPLEAPFARQLRRMLRG